MSTTEKMKIIDKVKIILKTINMMIEKSEFYEGKIGDLLIQDLKDIIKEKKLFENIDIERISSFEKNYITIDDFKDSDTFYDIVYEMLLNKIDKFTKENENRITLFRTFNQAYFYKNFIKYMSHFIDKYQETLNDDIIKEKIFEIVHSLRNSEKIYIQDFYFYISMFTIHYYYPKNDVSFPEFEKFNDISFVNKKMKLFLAKIKEEKLLIIDRSTYYLKCVNSKSKLFELFSIIEKEREENIIFNTKNYEDLNLNKIITDSDKKLIKLMKEKDNDLMKLKEYLDNDSEVNKIFEFYYIDEMRSFLLLNEEDKYVIMNSYNANEQLSLHILNYVEMKRSYDEGMKKQNILKNTIQNIIEDEEFFNYLRDIFTSEKVTDYCKNPLQYQKGTSDIYIYDEKEKEKEKNKKRFKKGNKNKTISKFIYPKEKDKQESKEIINYETQGIPDICSKTLDDDLKDIKKEEEEYTCQLYLDYKYFMKNVFDKNFLKERIIYSFLPYGIKACVSLIPKIVINMCGNNIKSYNIETNDSENYKTILKALYTVIIMHELIHFIRREIPDRPLSNEYTPKIDKNNCQSGKSFIYYIFGTLVVMYMDLEFAKVILNKDSWKKGCKSLKDQYLRFKDKKDDEIINSFKENELIKCYDSIIEIKDEPEEDYDFCCRFTA